MKKFLALGALALTLASFPVQDALAWKNSSFSMGMSWNHSSGGNNLLWGAYRNGQPGACDLPNCPAHFYALQHGYTPYGGGYGGGYGGHGPAPFAAPYPAPVAPPAIPAPTPVPGAQSYWYSQPAFQTVNYGYGR